MKTRSISIRKRIIIVFTLIIGLQIISTGWTVSMIGVGVNSKDKVYTQYGKASGEFGMACRKYESIKFQLRNLLYVFDGQESSTQYIDKITTIKKEMMEYVKEFEALSNQDDVEQKQMRTETMDAVNKYIADVDECIALYKEGKIQEARENLEKSGIQTALDADAKIDKLHEMFSEKAKVRNTEINSKVNFLVAGVIIIVLIAIFITFIGEIRLVKAFIIPMKMLQEGSKKLAKGDVSIEVNYNLNDEFGALIAEFNDMLNKIKEEAYVTKEIASGNLTVTITPKSAEDVMGNALLQVITDNNRVLGNIKESTAQVTTGSEQVASASQSLAQGSTEQASAIEEITASIDNIAERTRTNAEQANKANTLVSTAREDAQQGNLQMKEMLSAMSEINDSSENISKIIKVIDDIAFQTNILALNAAVEAARAGSHGKGFAVVAEEVRNLAGKSASAASETAEMIEDSIHKVEHGAKLAAKTEAALEEIVSAVESIVGIISNIADTSNEQATAVTQIDQAITQVSQVVQTNSATSEQCAAASEELSNQSIKLRKMIERFRLKNSSRGDNTYSSASDDYAEANNEKIISLGNGFDKY